MWATSKDRISAGINPCKYGDGVLLVRYTSFTHGILSGIGHM